jgi:hypothetical protein
MTTSALGVLAKESGLGLSVNHTANFVQTSQNKLRAASSIKYYNFEMKLYYIEAQHYCQSKAVDLYGI